MGKRFLGSPLSIRLFVIKVTKSMLGLPQINRKPLKWGLCLFFYCKDMCFLLENFSLETSNNIENLEVINVGKSKNISIRDELSRNFQKNTCSHEQNLTNVALWLLFTSLSSS